MSLRRCVYCDCELPRRHSKCCLADECKAKHAAAKAVEKTRRWRERYAEEPEYRAAVLARNAAWRVANPETVAAIHKAYYEKHRTARIEEASRRATTRRALKLATQVLPFTPDELRARLSMYHGCWICGSSSWDEVDHVKPLSRGGPHILANLRPACRPCNRRKSATWPIPTSRKAQ